MSFRKNRSSSLVIMIATIVMIVLLGTAVGCSKTPATLEEYYDVHPDQLQKEVDDFKNSLSSDDFSDSSLTVSGNRIKMTGVMNFNLDEVDTDTKQLIISTLEDYLNDLGSARQMAAAVKDTESITGIKGITLTMIYADNRGRELASITYDANGIA